MSINNGGPAFPTHEVYEHCGFDGNSGPHVQQTTNHGLSVRDYFAAKAMQGSRARGSQYSTWDDLAADSYEIADAMLRAREAS